MKFKLLALFCAVLGISAGVATAAGAVVTINVRPYVGTALGIGSSDPGDPSNVLCLVLQDGAVAYNGKVNGVVVPSRAGELDIKYRAQDLVTVLPDCVPTDITVQTVDATNIAIQAVAPKTGGTLQISTVSAVQPGISATAVTSIIVHYSAGQIVKLPSGATVTAGALSGGSSVTLDLKPTVTITKSLLDLAACSDSQYLIDTNTPDDNIKSGAPTATKINLATPLVGTPHLGSSGVYVATLRGCAQQGILSPGKTATTKIAITGAGAASVDFVQAKTVNPSTWDTTRGTTCATVKTNVLTFGTTPLQSSRVIQCKGAYGTPIPLSLDVRGWVASGVGFKDSTGLIHPAPPVEILAHTFT